jgi:hypothetical protein
MNVTAVAWDNPGRSYVQRDVEVRRVGSILYEVN